MNNHLRRSPTKVNATSNDTLWWLSPVGLILGFLLPIFLSIVLVGYLDTSALQIRGIRFLTEKYIALGIALVLVMALGAWVGEKIDLKPHAPIVERNWQPVLWVLGLIALGAYMIWFKDILFNPITLFGVLTGSIKMSRQEIGATPGITSLVNFIPVYFAIATYVWTTNSKNLPKRLKILTATLFGLTVFRVFVWSERLALIELLAAVALPWTANFYKTTQNQRLKKLLQLGPIIALPALVMYFGLAEYFRSWQSATYNGKTDFWTFALGRLGTYYYTSLNNGAGMLEMFKWPTYQFENTLLFAHKAPGMFGPLFSYYTELKQFTNEIYLKAYGDPEFNNPSGLYSVVYDIGIHGGFMYYAAMGLLSGIFYRSFLSGGARGIVLYPLCFVMMLEIYRYPYFGAPRAFTSLLGAIFAIAIIGTAPTIIKKKYKEFQAITIRRK